MRKEDFEALIIDYIEGGLSAELLAQFEQAKSSSPELDYLLTQYQFITNAIDSIGKEEYRASPGFRYRVMERVEKEAISPFAKFFDLFALNRQVIGGIATALLFVLAIYLPQKQYKELSPIPAQTTKDEISHDSPDEEIIIDYPKIQRKYQPIAIARFASTGERIDITPGAQSERTSPIENLLNVVGTTFPVGDQIPLAVSAEAVLSPRDYSQVIFRTSLSAIPREGSDGEIAQDIKVEYVLSGDNIVSIEPLGNPAAKEEVSKGSLLWARGESMIAEQQFTSIALINLKDPSRDNHAFIKIIVTYTDSETREKKKVTLDFPSSKIEKQLSKASPGLQQAFWMSFKDKLSPGVYSKITPEAYKNLHGMIEGMMKDLMDPNPESMERFEKKLEALRPTPKPLRIPPGLRGKLTKEQLKALYPNWVEEDGSKIE